MLQHCISSIIAENKAASQTTPKAQGLISHALSAGNCGFCWSSSGLSPSSFLAQQYLKNSTQFFSWGVIGVQEDSVCLPSRFSCVQLFGTPWTVAHQAPLSMGFSRQEYWSGLLLPPSGNRPHPGIKPHLFCLLLWQTGFFLPLAPPVEPSRRQPWPVKLLLRSHLLKSVSQNKSYGQAPSQQGREYPGRGEQILASRRVYHKH